MKRGAFISNIMFAMVAGIHGEKRVYLFRLSGYIPRTERTRKRSSWIGHHQISLLKLLPVASQEEVAKAGILKFLVRSKWSFRFSVQFYSLSRKMQ
ncbi:hypothetical protein CEXT_36741 [Caerostris extrusa]|uniref:Uncharacterized protein n=1 Tax=Caerostris extrusa TaxID=172846 RepID=A0AAV4UMC2_CAEEX|nr:hypothetical protein CEXT_36741 [Caerostris extrusa]